MYASECEKSHMAVNNIKKKIQRFVKDGRSSK